MNRRQVKSMDGIIPGTGRRNVYITKTKPQNLPNRVISFQPRSEAITQGVRKIPSKYLLANNDLVLRLPRQRVLHARVVSLMQYIAFAVVAIFAAGNSTLGQYFVLAFAVYVLFFRKSSQPTFIIALILLVSIPLFQILKQTGVADNMAIYTYELLVIGTLQAIIELKWPNRKNSSV